MKNNIVIFTDYYMEGIISIVESTNLTINLTAVSSYKDCLQTVMTTPNLLGVLCIDHIATDKTPNFYHKLVTTLDEIALSAERPLTLSVMYRSKYIPSFLGSVESTAISLAMCKFDKINEEMIRLDGLAPIISSTLGVFRTVVPKHFEVSPESQAYIHRNEYLDSLIYMLSDDPNDEILLQHFKKHPKLKMFYSLRESDKHLAECRELFEDSAFQIFCDMMLEKRGVV